MRDVFLKQARELATGWRSVLREGRDPIKERNKQKREAISNLHYLQSPLFKRQRHCFRDF